MSCKTNKNPKTPSFLKEMNRIQSDCRIICGHAKILLQEFFSLVLKQIFTHFTCTVFE